MITIRFNFVHNTTITLEIEEDKLLKLKTFLSNKESFFMNTKTACVYINYDKVISVEIV